MWPALKRLVISLVRVSFEFLKNAYMQFQIHNEDRTVKIFLLGLLMGGLVSSVVWHDMSNLGTIIHMVVLLCFSELYRFWFMCGYYILIKHLHGNMTRLSTWDRGSIDQISPLSIAPYVYVFWMNVLGTGTPSLSHLLYMPQELSHTFLHHCNGIWHIWNPYGLLMSTLHD